MSACIFQTASVTFTSILNVVAQEQPDVFVTVIIHVMKFLYSCVQKAYLPKSLTLHVCVKKYAMICVNCANALETLEDACR